MNTSNEDFDKLGLTSDDWKAFILGKGVIDPLKLESARAVVVRLGGYNPKQAADTELTDFALRTIGTKYSYLWLKGETVTYEDEIRLLQVKDGCSREEAVSRLEQVRKDEEEAARILGKGNQ
jgi:hypothetical protein